MNNIETKVCKVCFYRFERRTKVGSVRKKSIRKVGSVTCSKVCSKLHWRNRRKKKEYMKEYLMRQEVKERIKGYRNRYKLKKLQNG